MWLVRRRLFALRIRRTSRCVASLHAPRLAAFDVVADGVRHQGTEHQRLQRQKREDEPPVLLVGVVLSASPQGRPLTRSLTRVSVASPSLD